jgi:hypothetical protein
MFPLKKLKSFVFDGFLTDSILKNLEKEGVVLERTSSEIHSEPILDFLPEDFSLSTRINAKKMTLIYALLFCFENSVRELVSQRLNEKYGADWWNLKVNGTIKKKVSFRKKEDEKNRWHGPRAKIDIAYANFGDLNDIIVENYADFEDLFPDPDWVQAKIGDLERSRNVIAHNNVLSEADIERIRMYIKDWIQQVGGKLYITYFHLSNFPAPFFLLSKCHDKCFQACQNPNRL